ncbi:MAG: DUF1611 domain-containing protein [Sphingomicrobium sp.]
MTNDGQSAQLVERAGEPLLSLPAPYLLFLGDTVEPSYAKTAFGLRDWAPDQCIGEFALPSARVTTGLQPMSPAEARTQGARSLLIGVANAGGFLPQSWVPALLESLEAGLDVVSGMHDRLGDVPELAAAAARLGRRLIDVRVSPDNIPVATGRKRSGRRLLTVGTDCALGKKYTALAIARGLAARGMDVQFRATGQTGMMIAGSGIAIDSVVADFLAGAAEALSPDAAPDHLDVIEGQGSLFHPAYGAVSLGLLHGSQPDLFVVCDEPGRTEILGNPGYPIPTIEQVIELTLSMGRLTNPAIRCCGISLNTAGLDETDAAQLMEATARRLGLPVADPVRGHGLEQLLDACAPDGTGHSGSGA